MESEGQIVAAILRQNEFLFRRHLVLSKTVLDQMKSSGLITDVTRRKIMREPAYQQVPVLLNSLENRSLLSLKKFLDVLKNTGHSWLVDHILDTDVSAGPQGRSKDDIGYGRGRSQTRYNYTRPPAQITDAGRNVRYADLRKSVSAGVALHDSRVNNNGGGVSLASLLQAREPPNPESAPRGVFNARTLLTDPLVTSPASAYPAQITTKPLQLPGLPYYQRQNPPSYIRSKEDIPSTLYNLNQAFSDQDQRNQQALSVLRQEEIAIRQLMEQNARDQGNVRRHQAAVQDIVSRLKDIHNRAKEVYEPSPHPNIGRYRLAQLNQIPWSIDG